MTYYNKLFLFRPFQSWSKHLHLFLHCWSIGWFHCQLERCRRFLVRRGPVHDEQRLDFQFPV